MYAPCLWEPDEPFMGRPSRRPTVGPMRRTVVVLVAAAWLVGGISAAYAYVHDYWVRRGFPALATPAGVARGRLETVRFYSPAVQRESRYLVYLPPGYGSGNRFGVLYLL